MKWHRWYHRSGKDADRIKNDVHLQITRARNDALNKIATYEAGQMAQAARPAAPAAGGQRR